MIVPAKCRDWSSFVITVRMKIEKNIAIAKNDTTHIIVRPQSTRCYLISQNQISDAV